MTTLADTRYTKEWSSLKEFPNMLLCPYRELSPKVLCPSRQKGTGWVVGPIATAVAENLACDWWRRWQIRKPKIYHVTWWLTTPTGNNIKQLERLEARKWNLTFTAAQFSYNFTSGCYREPFRNEISWNSTERGEGSGCRKGGRREVGGRGTGKPGGMEWAILFKMDLRVTHTKLWMFLRFLDDKNDTEIWETERGENSSLSGHFFTRI